MIEIVTGSLLDATEKYICHQANCLSHYASGIAKVIFNKYPYADIYTNRFSPDEPGDIIICGDGVSERYVINLLGQYQPGGLTDVVFHDKLDTASARQKYFHKALNKIAKIPNLESIAFNYKIGCGLAGGNWDWYFGELNNFAAYVNKTQQAIVKIYKLEGDI